LIPITQIIEDLITQTFDIWTYRTIMIAVRFCCFDTFGCLCLICDV
jgi:hypothetical protein